MKPRVGVNEWTVPWRPTQGESTSGVDIRPAPEYTASQQDIETFQRDGVVFLPGEFVDWVKPLQMGLERNLADPRNYAFPCESTEEEEAGRFFDSYCNWERIPEYKEFVFNSYAASMAGHFMESQSAQFFHEHSFVKESGTQRATPWHQDLPYYCVDGRQTVSIYISLDEVPKDIAVRFVVGSHRWDKLFYPRHFISGEHFDQQGSELDSVPEIDADEHNYEIRCWDMKPGDTILFSFRTLHGTTDNQVKNRRRAFSTRWLGDDAVYCERPGEMSPPYPDIGLNSGDKMRQDWFPVIWKRP
ncbi:MAG: phytanoyl-CoA dioxygenase family protein [Gammaproteobacteria bacterium]|nr:phytanoyl-CoA dioxygenase family protein [Gammaproteobacteria bacterium]